MHDLLYAKSTMLVFTATVAVTVWIYHETLLITEQVPFNICKQMPVENPYKFLQLYVVYNVQFFVDSIDSAVEHVLVFLVS